MEKKNKKELTFWAIGILMVFIVVLGSVFAIRFVIKNLSDALQAGEEGPADMLRFHIEQANEALER